MSKTKLDAKIEKAARRVGLMNFAGNDPEREGRPKWVKSLNPFEDSLITDAAFKQAQVFAEVLKGDAGFLKAGDNYLALESMLVGWMSGQSWFKAHEGFLARHYPKDDIYLFAQQLARETASNAVSPRDKTFGGGK